MTVDPFHRRSRGTWTLTAAAFERLLKVLHPEREKAAVEYERLRDRITGLLGWWGSPRASELADETLDRVARKLDEGAEVRAGSLGAYVRGVARMVFYESSRQQQPDPLPHDLDLSAPVTDEEQGPALICFDRCLAKLSAVDRKNLLRYYDDTGGRTIEARRKLADELGISPNVLRVRMHRLRDRLEQCVAACRADS